VFCVLFSKKYFVFCVEKSVSGGSYILLLVWITLFEKCFLAFKKQKVFAKFALRFFYILFCVLKSIFEKVKIKKCCLCGPHLKGVAYRSHI
jgi:hypothetical protein